jgi:hypothetical protein
MGVRVGQLQINMFTSRLKKLKRLTWVRCQCFDALAMGSVTCVQAAPNNMSLWGPLCIMSKKALTPTAALHWKCRDLVDAPGEKDGTNWVLQVLNVIS